MTQDPQDVPAEQNAAGEKTVGEAPLLESTAAKIEHLEKQLAEAEQKSAQNWDKTLRAVAELDNVRRRAERDVENAHKFALERFIQALLPVLDSLEKTLETSVEDVKVLREGVQLTHKMLGDVMAKFGLETVDPQGIPFDPHTHEAMAMVPDATVPSNTVIKVYQKGYRLYGRVVRPARVVVSQ